MSAHRNPDVSVRSGLDETTRRKRVAVGIDRYRLHHGVGGFDRDRGDRSDR